MTAAEQKALDSLGRQLARFKNMPLTPARIATIRDLCALTVRKLIANRELVSFDDLEVQVNKRERSIHVQPIHHMTKAEHAAWAAEVGVEIDNKKASN